MFAALQDADFDEAVANAQQVATNAKRAGEVFMTRFGSTYVGFAHYLRGAYGEASRVYVPLVQAIGAISSFRAKAPMMELAAYLAIEYARPREGALLLATAERLRELTGAPLLRPWYEPHDRAVARSRASLGDATFDQAWSEGRRADPGEALQRANEIFVERAHRSARGERQRGLRARRRAAARRP
jgi:hypothetical protein